MVGAHSRQEHRLLSLHHSVEIGSWAYPISSPRDDRVPPPPRRVRGPGLEATHVHAMLVCSFSWRYNPLWLCVYSPVAGFSLLVFASFLGHNNDVPQSVGLLWMSDQSVAQTSTWQHTTLTTNIHATGGIRTHHLSRRAAEHLHLRPRGHWDRHIHANRTLQKVWVYISDLTHVFMKRGLVK
jgi:hypothetical protein